MFSQCLSSHIEMQNLFLVMRTHKICSLNNIQVYHVDNYIALTLMGFPSDSVGKESEFFSWFNPWVRKIPWRRKWQPTQYSCLENSMKRESGRATVHGITKNWTQWCDFHFFFSFHYNP